MDIVLYPDPRLRAPNTPVTAFDEDLAQVSRDMFELMYKTQGVGLAAPQVGLNQRFMVFNATGDAEEADQEVVLCNPNIVHKAKTQESDEEGCLSFPGVHGSILRPIEIKVQALNLEGEDIELELEGWEARIFLHEFDHLQGVLFIDRMSAADKTIAKPILQDLQAHFKERAGH